MTSGTRHLLQASMATSAAAGMPGTLNRWEQAVLGREVARDAVVGWYRNQLCRQGVAVDRLPGSDDLWHWCSGFPLR